MDRKASDSIVTAIGIDIGKNTFHLATAWPTSEDDVSTKTTFICVPDGDAVRIIQSEMSQCAAKLLWRICHCRGNRGLAAINAKAEPRTEQIIKTPS
jgi:hypothetical protein